MEKRFLQKFYYSVLWISELQLLPNEKKIIKIATWWLKNGHSDYGKIVYIDAKKFAIDMRKQLPDRF